VYREVRKVRESVAGDRNISAIVVCLAREVSRADPRISFVIFPVHTPCECQVVRGMLRVFSAFISSSQCNKVADYADYCRLDKVAINNWTIGECR